MVFEVKLLRDFAIRFGLHKASFLGICESYLFGAGSERVGDFDGIAIPEAKNLVPLVMGGIGRVRLILENNVNPTDPCWIARKSSSQLPSIGAFSINLGPVHRGKHMKWGFRGDSPLFAYVQEINSRYREEPTIWSSHRCDLCYPITKDYSGGNRKVFVQVCDGICVGHRVCSVHNCEERLDNARHRHCKKHHHLDSVCSIVGCECPVEVSGELTMTCGKHHGAEKTWRAQRTGYVSHIRLKLKHKPGRGQMSKKSKKALKTGGKVETTLKHTFGNRTLHANVLAHFPCGVISKRNKVFGGETTLSIVQMLDRAFPPGYEMPYAAYYDKASTVLKGLLHDTPNSAIMPFIAAWSVILWIVDAFHFASHSKEDQISQLCCNPEVTDYKYRNLFRWSDEKQCLVRRFNSEIAEQNNKWMEGFGIITRNMHGEEHDFWLDLACNIKNEHTMVKLEGKELHPRFIVQVNKRGEMAASSSS